MKRFDTKYQKAQFQRFARICDRDSPPLVMILKAHLLTESLLETFIRSFLRRGDILAEQGRLSYSQKLAFFQATDYGQAELYSVLRTLNKVRNRLAHSAESEVSPADVKALCACYGDYFKQPKYKRETSDELLYMTLLLAAAMLSFLCEEVTKSRKTILNERKSA